MLGILGGDERCPIARSLDVLGEKWTLMIVRDAIGGSTRFSQFQQSLGIPREVLTARLASLVDGGVLERTTYKPEGARAREEYVLTDAGRDLSLVLLALGGLGRPAPPVRAGVGPALRRRGERRGGRSRRRDRGCAAAHPDRAPPRRHGASVLNVTS
ncbi:helix-turn-helix domain-containing protein [Curtobacterium flaccumfaciens pv. flaccumfaciens]